MITGNDIGGASNHVISLCKSKSDFICKLGCVGNGLLAEKAKEAGIDYIVFKNINEIKNHLRNVRYDLIDFHGARANLVHMILKKNINVPTVTTIHSDFRYDFISNKFKKIFFTPLNTLSLHSFRNFICVSENIYDLLDSKHYIGEKVLIDNGIDFDNCKIEKTADEIKNMYKISKNDFVYMNVARLHPIKNQINMIYGFEKLTHEIKNIKLVIVGDGEQKEKLNSLVNEMNIQSHVVFAGFQKHPYDFINIADISVLTSFNEGLPLTILESAALKKPLICSNIASLKKIVNNENGYLINPNSIDNIYEAMKKAYFEKDSLTIKGQMLYNFAVSNYSINVFYHNYYNLYNKLTKGEIYE